MIKTKARYYRMGDLLTKTPVKVYKLFGKGNKMTSIARQILRRNPNYESSVNPQYTEYDVDGGYVTVHPTKGPRRVSARRIKAQENMMLQFGFIR